MNSIGPLVAGTFVAMVSQPGNARFVEVCNQYVTSATPSVAFSVKPPPPKLPVRLSGYTTRTVTVLHVTHNRTEAERLGDVVFRM